MRRQMILKIYLVLTHSLARVVEAAEEEEGEYGDVRQPHSSQFRAEPEDEVDLLGDLRMEHAMPSRGGANLDDDVDFERLMLGPVARSQSTREVPTIASSQLRRKGSHTQSAAPSQATKRRRWRHPNLRKERGRTKVKHVA
ncbi:hypothetical protein Taro_029455 [Colocasia esculenta]|uniref:Secreted protein n=1 Tax=Colocasia esculenta TaxID=4460 RepID=A0A843VP42_COLES|nr:hypothetical protein [Colocasia esculenta]